MMNRMLCLVAGSLVLLGAAASPVEAGHRLGGGLEYLETLGDIKDAEGFDSSAFGFLASYQYAGPLLKIEADAEWILDYGGTDKSLFQPQAYVLLGDLIYGGVGIGIGQFDGEWQSDPFYALRAGVDLALAGVDLDVFGLYRFQDAEVIEGLDESDLDSLTFGALLRFDVGN